MDFEVWSYDKEDDLLMEKEVRLRHKMLTSTVKKFWVFLAQQLSSQKNPKKKNPKSEKNPLQGKPF